MPVLMASRQYCYEDLCLARLFELRHFEDSTIISMDLFPRWIETWFEGGAQLVAL
jgi:hypothetical protein